MIFPGRRLPISTHWSGVRTMWSIAPRVLIIGIWGGPCSRPPHEAAVGPRMRIAALMFWGPFLMSALSAAGQVDFRRRHIVGDPFFEQLDQMYARNRFGSREDGLQRSDTMMAGFYIQHNTSIGIRCFAWESCSESAVFTSFGATRSCSERRSVTSRTKPYSVNFYTFVTAHSSCELTAIVVWRAAGLRMGWGLIDTQGQSRLSSSRREAVNALPALGTAVVLFVLAAFIEGYVSPSSIPYPYKAAVALVGTAAIVAYFGAWVAAHVTRMWSQTKFIRRTLIATAKLMMNAEATDRGAGPIVSV